MPTTRFDGSFSHPDATATPWERTQDALERAELFWLTTVRADGRPHVTPLVGLWLDDAAWFTTGEEEQKARNLARSPNVALTTGSNTWARGLDVVVEGTAVRTTERADLERVAEAFVAKYGDDWRFGVEDEGLSAGGHPSWLFRLAPTKVLAFAKDPHGQTGYDFG